MKFHCPTGAAVQHIAANGKWLPQVFIWFVLILFMATWTAGFTSVIADYPLALRSWAQARLNPPGIVPAATTTIDFSKVDTNMPPKYVPADTYGANGESRPELRQLRPFTSLFWLCFSRTTMFPWVTVNCTARPIGDGRFRISNGTWGVNSDGDRVLGEGDAVKAADILAANLPPNCGPAIHGTAEEWEEQEGQ